MHEPIRTVFDEMPWERPAPGVRFKAVAREGTRLRLVEFTDEFVEREWCTKGHVGYVLEGTLELSFAHATLRLSAGQGVFILAGEAEKHKARVVGIGCWTVGWQVCPKLTSFGSRQTLQ